MLERAKLGSIVRLCPAFNGAILLTKCIFALCRLSKFDGECKLLFWKERVGFATQLMVYLIS